MISSQRIPIKLNDIMPSYGQSVFRTEIKLYILYGLCVCPMNMNIYTIIIRTIAKTIEGILLLNTTQDHSSLSLHPIKSFTLQYRQLDYWMYLYSYSNDNLQEQPMHTILNNVAQLHNRKQCTCSEPMHNSYQNSTLTYTFHFPKSASTVSHVYIAFLP
jgi:hypothetical protein